MDGLISLFGKDFINRVSVLILETLLVLIFLRLVKRQKTDLKLTESEIDKLVEDFKPNDLIDFDVDENDIRNIFSVSKYSNKSQENYKKCENNKKRFKTIKVFNNTSYETNETINNENFVGNNSLIINSKNCDKKIDIYHFNQKNNFKLSKNESNTSDSSIFPSGSSNMTQLKPKSIFNLADQDFFNSSNENKKILANILKKYGVGTCGPPGFYGTLDIHLELEKTISKITKKDSILYSNLFTCINSVIYCFCRRYDQIFFHADCNEAILRGILSTKCQSYDFNNVNDLKNKLDKNFNRQKRNFLILEGIFKNTGAILNLPEYLKIKQKYELFLIIDESLSLPLLNGICNYHNIDNTLIDIIIGSLIPYNSNGGFVSANKYAVDYQRLLAPAYCFSASLPGFLAKNAILNMTKKRNFKRLLEIGEYFFKNINSKEFEVSYNSPIVVIRRKIPKIPKKYNFIEKDQRVKDLIFFKNLKYKLSSFKIIVSLVINPSPGIRIFPKINLENEHLQFLVNTINNFLSTNNFLKD
ncbi:Serine palmitoyltransferase 1 [Dictyocoela muelleri]|nr:Serine palmitoyltransferase 1 [Dictyocoela muelleri]